MFWNRSPGIDPTKNVLDLVDTAISSLRREVALRAEYENRLRSAETARIDAIRAVDVGAVNRAAEVAADAASSLAAAVQASAEALRTQVAAAATASTVALAAEIDPLKKDIRELRDAQSRTVGGRDQTGESRLTVGAVLGAVTVGLVFVFGVAGIAIQLLVK